MVGLSRTAALVARLGTAVEVRFAHMLPPEPSAADHDRALQEAEAAVKQHFGAVPPTCRVSCDALEGPLIDRLLAYAAEQEVELLLVGRRPGLNVQAYSFTPWAGEGRRGHILQK